MRNQSQAIALLAKSSIVSLVVTFTLFAAAGAMAGDPIYKWKDANGQSHYSQQAPEGIKYETISTSGLPAGSSTAVVSTPAASTAPTAAASGPTQADTTRQKNCDVARKNSEDLATRPVVDMDIHGDGKPVRLTPEQQTAQLNLSKQQVSAFCSK